MSSEATFPQQTPSLWATMGQRGQIAVALAVGVVLALVTWQAGVLDSNLFGFASGAAVEAGDPGSLVAIGAAFVIGSTMIALPCGYPSVFVMPSILGSRKGLGRCLRLLGSVASCTRALRLSGWLVDGLCTQPRGRG